MAEHPFEPFGTEFRRAMEELGTRLNEEMKRVQQQLDGAMERVAAEVQQAMEEFQREREGPVRPDRPRRKREPVDRISPKMRRASPKKRPRRKPPGSAAAPVKPKPKPTPLKDGAEAPVD